MGSGPVRTLQPPSLLLPTTSRSRSSAAAAAAAAANGDPSLTTRAVNEEKVDGGLHTLPLRVQLPAGQLHRSPSQGRIWKSGLYSAPKGEEFSIGKMLHIPNFCK